VPVSTLAAELRPFTLTGIGIMLTTGPLMLSAAPERGYGNPAFSFKMSFLLLALVTHFTIHRRVAMQDRGPGVRLGERLAACLSLLLWTGVVAGGRQLRSFEEFADDVFFHILPMDRDHFAEHRDTGRRFVLSDSRHVPFSRHRLVRRNGIDRRPDRTTDRFARGVCFAIPGAIFALEVGGFAVVIVSVDCSGGRSR
jgi:hypothetical protein